MDTLHPFFYTRRPGPAAAPRSPVERDTNFPSLHSEGHGDLRCPFFFFTARRRPAESGRSLACRTLPRAPSCGQRLRHTPGTKGVGRITACGYPPATPYGTHLWVTSASYALRRHIPSQHPVNPCSRRSPGKK
ncbi:TPA: hypothetical protein L6B76_24710 [Pseudomonas aeruginosa]|nr:hypothetical protein [Pseudomonas aeruginosa]